MELVLARGARVIAAASERDRVGLTELGAGGVVAREDGDLGQAVRRILPGGADGVLDTASLAGAALGAIRDGGRYVTVTATPEPERGIKVARIVGVANAPALAKLV
jgi:NADPH:quinone reductase-like Zn-dependent oxidoreductase